MKTDSPKVTKKTRSVLHVPDRNFRITFHGSRIYIKHLKLCIWIVRTSVALRIGSMHRYLRKQIIESSGNTECLRIKQMPNVSGDIIHSLLYAGFKEVNTYLSVGPLS